MPNMPCRLRLISNSLIVLFLSMAVLAQSTSPQSTPAVPNDPKVDGDSADIPPFASGRISHQEYLERRDQQLEMQRGVNDLARDPLARSRAINLVVLQELKQKLLLDLGSLLAGSSPPVWTPLGPDPIPNGQTDPNFQPANELPVSGRVTAIAVDPNNENIVYVGTAQGGLYRSMDGGATWTPLMDSAQSLAIGAITFDPTDNNTLFIGTGEGNLSVDSFFGVGVYIIQNATTTATLSGPFNLDTTGADVFTGRAITQILVNPTDHNKILVSTSSGFSGVSAGAFSTRPIRGVYLSTNALSGNPMFTRLTIQPANVANLGVTDMVMDPGNPSRILVNLIAGLLTDPGDIWVPTSGDPWSGTATWARVNAMQGVRKFAVNRSGNPAATTFFAANAGGISCNPPSTSIGHGILTKSTDGGMTWTILGAATGFCGGQCFYDLPVAVDPADPNIIYLGGSAGNQIGSCGPGIMGKSIDGGASFHPSQNFLHADSHATVVAPSNHSVIYAGNDGGIFRSNDAGATWNSINSAGFNATQFESLSVHPTDPTFSIGGTQDNGTEFLKPDGSWTRADFGDGGFSAIDQNSTSTVNVTMYHTYFNVTGGLIGFARVTSTSSASEGNWAFLGCQGADANGITCADDVLFYVPLALGPGTPNTVYFGTDHLYRSTDEGNNNIPASQVLAPDPTLGNVPISSIGISTQDDNVRIVGLSDGQVFATTAGANPMTDVTGGWTPMYVARAVIDPNKKTTAYVTLDGYGTPNHVWKTTNLSGEPPTPTWASASSGLPDVPVNAFAVDPFDSSNLYAGTDIGVFNSTDGGNSWNPYGTGLPRVAVFDLNIQPTSHKVRIGTHGRGAWEIVAASFANTTSLSASTTSPFLGTSVNLTAQVNKGAGVPTPTGMVTFMDGTSTLGSPVGLDSTGKATLQTSSLSLGAHSITAQYSGDKFYVASASTVTTITVMPPDYSISIPTGSAMVSAGQPASYTININPLGPFTSAVNFACAGLPQATSCTFNPPTVTPNGGPGSTTLTISTTARMTQTAGISPGWLSGAGLFGLVLVGGLANKRVRRKSFCMMLSLLALAVVLTSCGGGHHTITTGTPAGTFSITVTATSGTTTHQSTVTLTVQ